jgi:hypothetical protein
VVKNRVDRNAASEGETDETEADKT